MIQLHNALEERERFRGYTLCDTHKTQRNKANNE